MAEDLIHFDGVLEHLVDALEFVVGQVLVVCGVLSLEDLHVVLILIFVFINLGIAVFHGFLYFGNQGHDDWEFFEPKRWINKF